MTTKEFKAAATANNLRVISVKTISAKGNKGFRIEYCVILNPTTETVAKIAEIWNTPLNACLSEITPSF